MRITDKIGFNEPTYPYFFYVFGDFDSWFTDKIVLNGPTYPYSSCKSDPEEPNSTDKIMF